MGAWVPRHKVYEVYMHLQTSRDDYGPMETRRATRATCHHLIRAGPVISAPGSERTDLGGALVSRSSDLDMVGNGVRTDRCPRITVTDPVMMQVLEQS